MPIDIIMRILRSRQSTGSTVIEGAGVVEITQGCTSRAKITYAGQEKTQLSSLLEWMGMRADFVHEELFSTAIG